MLSTPGWHCGVYQEYIRVLAKIIVYLLQEGTGEFIRNILGLRVLSKIMSYLLVNLLLLSRRIAPEPSSAPG